MKYLLLISFFEILVLASNVKADSCNVSENILSVKSLSCMKRDPLSREIRLGLLKYKEQKLKCSKCKELYLNVKKYFPSIQNKLLILAKSKNEFGGQHVYAVSDKFDGLYRFWLYETDPGDFSLREIERLNLKKSLVSDIKQNTDYGKYWLYISE